MLAVRSGVQCGIDRWSLLKNGLVAKGAPGGTWFAAFFNTDNEAGIVPGYKKAIDHITIGKTPDRATVQDMRKISTALRPYILSTDGNPEVAGAVQTALTTIRLVAYEQLTQVADRLVRSAEKPRPAADVRGYRNLFWRVYACDIPLLRGDGQDDPLAVATEQFASALREWEDSPDGQASRDTIDKLKAARRTLQSVRATELNDAPRLNTGCPRGTSPRPDTAGGW